jgi:hypothetical protein
METRSLSVLISSIAVDSYIVIQITFSGGAEGLDGEHIAFFHALIGFGLDEGDLLVAMDLVTEDVMASDVANCFDRNNLSVKLDFVALHYFLNRLTDVIDPGIDASFLEYVSVSYAPLQSRFTHLQPDIGGCFDSREQRVIDRIGSHGKCTVDNPAVDMDSEIHFQHVVVLEYNLIGSRIGSPVGANIIQAQSSWKTHAGSQSVPSLQTLMVGQGPNAILNLVSKMAQGDARFRNRLHILTDLAVHFSSFAIISQEVIVHVVHGI